MPTKLPPVADLTNRVTDFIFKVGYRPNPLLGMASIDDLAVMGTEVHKSLYEIFMAEKRPDVRNQAFRIVKKVNF